MPLSVYIELATRRLDSLPSVYLNERSELPEESAVYFAVNKEEEILYIGKSINLRKRWKNHHKLEALKSINGVRIAYLTLRIEDLGKVEYELIEYFAPPLNIRNFEDSYESKASKSRLKQSKAFNISLPEKWAELVGEISDLTGESMASIIQRATIAYLENTIATGLIDKLRSSRH